MTDPNDRTSTLRAAAGLRGLWLTCLSPFAIELAGTGGAQWLGIDLQHGDLGVDDLASLLRATDLPVLARSASHDPAQLARILDSAVDGLIVPGVESADQARNLVRATRVPPDGARSTGISRSARFGAARPLLLPMVETAAGLAEVDRIVAVPGIDGVFVGPYDLALSLGATSVNDPRVVRAIADILAATAGAGLLTGLFAGDPEFLAGLPPVGLVAVDSDVAALRIGLRVLFG